MSDTSKKQAPPGISRRDHFAGLAMQALLANPELRFVFRPSNDMPRFNGYNVGPHGERHVNGEDALSSMSYRIADAMLAARERGDG